MAKKAASAEVNRLLGSSLIASETVARAIQERLAKELPKQWRKVDYYQLLDTARDVLSEFEPVVSKVMTDSQLAAWVRGAAKLTKSVPKEAMDVFRDISNRPPVSSQFLDRDDPSIVFPKIEDAVADLFSRRVVTRDQFDVMAKEFQRDAFTVARQDSQEVIGRIRDVIAANVKDGGTKEQFEDSLSEMLGKSNLGPGHRETVYRVNVQTAYSRGQDEIASSPVMRQVFPYRQFYSVHDSRARRDHTVLEGLGLDNTGVYSSADRVWDYISPPLDFNCLLPGTKVSARNVQLAFRSIYKGTAVEIETASGNVVRVTANHGVLTDQGVVQARCINEGHNVLCNVDRTERDGSILREDVENEPASIEDIFASFAKSSPTIHAPASPLAFYGDAKRFKNGNVDAVGPLVRAWYRMVYLAICNTVANKRLMNRNVISTDVAGIRVDTLHHVGSRLSWDLSPSIFKSIGPCWDIDTSLHETKGDHVSADAKFFADGKNTHPLFKQAFDQFDVDGMTHAYETLPGAENLFAYTGFGAREMDGDLVGRHSSEIHPDAVIGENVRSNDLGRSSLWTFGWDDSTLSECSTYRSNGNPEFLSDLLERHSRVVHVDKVVRVRKFNFSGHVYDLQTSTGWLSGDNILLRQCRCGTRYLTTQQAARKGVREAQDWIKTGVEPEHESRVNAVLAAIEWPRPSGFTGPGTRRLSLEQLCGVRMSYVAVDTHDETGTTLWRNDELQTEVWRKEMPGAEPRLPPFKYKFNEQADIKMASGTTRDDLVQAEEHVADILGRPLTMQQIGLLAGALDGSKVGVENGESHVEISIDHPSYSSEVEITSVGEFYGNEEIVGEQEQLYIEKLGMSEEDTVLYLARGDMSTSTLGVAKQVLSQQIEMCQRLGIRWVTNSAERDKKLKRIGYYVWPLMGFDGPLEEDHLTTDLREYFHDMGMPPLVSSLMATRRGRALWKEQGSYINLIMDLREGSQSLRVFDAYMKRAGLKMSLNGNELSILESLWDEIGAVRMAKEGQRVTKRFGDESRTYQWTKTNAGLRLKRVHQNGKAAVKGKSKGKVRKGVTDRGISFDVEDGKGFDRSIKRLFPGQDVTASQLADLAGIKGAKVGFYPWGEGSMTLFASGNGWRSNTQLFNVEGKRSLRFNGVTVDKRKQGKGVGTELVRSALAQCRALGIDRMTLFASGSGDAWHKQMDRGDNGYYTWPRLGFDADVKFFNKVGPLGRFATRHGVTKVSGFMKSKKGRDLWKRYGRGQEMEFDTHPDSLSSKVLDRYVKAKARKASVSSKTTSSSKLTPVTVKDTRKNVLSRMAAWKAKHPFDNISISGLYDQVGKGLSPGQFRDQLVALTASKHIRLHPYTGPGASLTDEGTRIRSSDFLIPAGKATQAYVSITDADKTMPQLPPSFNQSAVEDVARSWIQLHDTGEPQSVAEMYKRANKEVQMKTGHELPAGVWQDALRALDKRGVITLHTTTLSEYEIEDEQYLPLSDVAEKYTAVQLGKHEPSYVRFAASEQLEPLDLLSEIDEELLDAIWDEIAEEEGIALLAVKIKRTEGQRHPTRKNLIWRGKTSRWVIDPRRTRQHAATGYSDNERKAGKPGNVTTSRGTSRSRHKVTRKFRLMNVTGSKNYNGNWAVEPRGPILAAVNRKSNDSMPLFMFGYAVKRDGGFVWPHGSYKQDVPFKGKVYADRDSAIKNLKTVFSQASKSVKDVNKKRVDSAVHGVVSKLSKVALERASHNIKNVTIGDNYGEIIWSNYSAMGWRLWNPLVHITALCSVASFGPASGRLTLPAYEIQSMPSQRVDVLTDLYTHEIAHAIDGGGQSSISASEEWIRAWEVEIKYASKPPSDYATTSVVEGFAEFARWALHSPNEASRRWPKCWNVWVNEGLVVDEKSQTLAVKGQTAKELFASVAIGPNGELGDVLLPEYSPYGQVQSLAKSTRPDGVRHPTKKHLMWKSTTSRWIKDPEWGAETESGPSIDEWASAQRPVEILTGKDAAKAVRGMRSRAGHVLRRERRRSSPLNLNSLPVYDNIKRVKSAKHAKKLSRAERQKLIDYTGAGGEKINSKIYRGKSLTRREQQTMKLANDVIKKHGKFRRKVQLYRGLSSPAAVTSLLKAMRSGTPLETKGLTSFTVDPSQADSYALHEQDGKRYVVRYIGRTGFDVSSASGWNEHEVLHPSGQYDISTVRPGSLLSYGDDDWGQEAGEVVVVDVVDHDPSVMRFAKSNRPDGTRHPSKSHLIWKSSTSRWIRDPRAGRTETSGDAPAPADPVQSPRVLLRDILKNKTLIASKSNAELKEMYAQLKTLTAKHEVSVRGRGDQLRGDEHTATLAANAIQHVVATLDARRLDAEEEKRMPQYARARGLGQIAENALDRAYGYGKAPSGSFGEMANRASGWYGGRAVQQKKNLKQVSEAIHEGWARAVRDNKHLMTDEQYQRRIKLAETKFDDLDVDEQMKDVVVARAVAKAVMGKKYWGSRYQTYWRPGPNPTVDSIITRTAPGGKRQVLLIKRGKTSAEAGKWALPGGFHDSDADNGQRWQPGKETAEEAALRELEQETGLDVNTLKARMKHVGFWGDDTKSIGRDPRDNEEAWAVSNAFHLDITELSGYGKVRGMDDAEDARWFDVSNVNRHKIAFDHKEMLHESGVLPKPRQSRQISTADQISRLVEATKDSLPKGIMGTAEAVANEAVRVVSKLDTKQQKAIAKRVTGKTVRTGKDAREVIRDKVTKDRQKFMDKFMERVRGFDKASFERDRRREEDRRLAQEARELQEAVGPLRMSNVWQVYGKVIRLDYNPVRVHKKTGTTLWRNVDDPNRMVWRKTRPGGKKPTGDLFGDALGEIESEEKRETYRAALSDVMGSMSPKAIERIKQNVRRVSFYRSQMALSSAGMLVSPLLADRFSRGRVTAGYYLKRHGGQLHLNGGGDHEVDQTYAHEIYHAVDGPNNRISNTKRWKIAYEAEIDVDGSPLSEYARTLRSEGFAEFGRLVYSDISAARKNFPKCWAVFKRWGLA